MEEFHEICGRAIALCSFFDHRCDIQKYPMPGSFFMRSFGAQRARIGFGLPVAVIAGNPDAYGSAFLEFNAHIFLLDSSTALQ
jgi:hypothetical protein